jgi:redox-sensitive bicupin YhaK (pirin superfamily)
MENFILHQADSRGHANHGWLDSYHSFSFAQYYNPERMHFGVLRVLNDDKVAGGAGFGTHPHDNMEIISIPLSGDLEHRDSMGNIQVIHENEIQILSAGTGITHSEYNKNTDKEVRFLQIWIYPKTRNVTPRYDQLIMKKEDRHNCFDQILSPSPDDEGVWIHQDAWFSLGEFEAGKSSSYTLHKTGNGIYLFIISGSLKINGITLDKRDGFGIWETDAISMEFITHSEALLMEVPMQN